LRWQIGPRTCPAAACPLAGTGHCERAVGRPAGGLLRMTTTSKLLLIVAVAMFAAGLTSWGGSLAHGLLKPLAAVLVIVVFMMELLPDEPAEAATSPPSEHRAKDHGP